ncbi:MAG: hypothetical protein ACHQU8_04145, partial [Gemmatimonadales bacterium]
MRGAPRVAHACALAARAGIVPGMALAQAKAFAHDLITVAWDGERLARAALEVTTALLAASPRVSWAGGRGGGGGGGVGGRRGWGVWGGGGGGRARET